MTDLTYGSAPAERLFVSIIRLLKNVTVEPVVFLYALGFSLTIIVTPSLYMEKICEVGAPILGQDQQWPNEVCNNLDNGNFNTTQDYVQKTYAKIQLVTMFVKGVPPIIFALFIGPWSDKFGRKFLIVFPLIGYALYNIWFLINVIFFETFVVEYLMLEFIQFWFGGYMCLFLGLYSYVSDISPVNTRTARIALVDFVFFTGLAIGSGVSGKIYTNFGYVAIYAPAAILQILAIVYALIFVKETHVLKAQKEGFVQNSNSNSEEAASSSSNNDVSLKKIFSLNHAKESFGVAFRKRQGGVRHIIIILISLFGLYSFANGIIGVNNQFARKRFEWENSQVFNEAYAQLQSIGTVFNLFAIGFLMPIMTQVLKMRDLSITGLCVTSSLLGIVTILWADTFELWYLANFFRMFSDVVTVGIRSALTKIVGEKDVGKVFACVGAIQALVGLISPVYQLIYAWTVDYYFVGFVYCISCCVLILMLVMTFYVYIFMRRHERRLKSAKLAQDQADLAFQPSYKKVQPL